MKVITTLAFKQILQGLRSVKTILILLVMPNLFLWILSSSFTQHIPTKGQIEDVSIKYQIEGEQTSIADIKRVIDQLQEVYTYVEPFEEEEYQPKQDIIIRFQEANQINIYSHQSLRDQSVLFKGLIQNMLQSTPILSAEEKVENQYILTKTYLRTEDRQSILDYYGVTMITLTIMFGSVLGAYSMIQERDSGTFKKLQTLPLTTGQLLVGKLLGSAMILGIEIGIILAMSIAVFEVKWGSQLGIIFLILWSEGILAIALGMGIGYGLKDNKSAWLILLLMIMLSGFMGGTFLPLGQMSKGLVKNFEYLSPIRTINEAIFGVIYSQELGMAYDAILMSLIATSILLIGTKWRMRER